jgi:drug/metabolite transporter (DMT)-like permease
MTDNHRGAAFMVAAMAGFAVEDMLLKRAGQGMPLGLVLMLFGAVGMALFAVLARQADEAVWHPAYLTRPLLIRCGFEVTGRLFYALSFVLTTLSQASAILQAAPLLVMAGAAVVFGERVSPARWGAVLAGLAGVMLILRPVPGEFSALALLAVIGTIVFVGRDLATRAAPRILSWRQLGVLGFAMLIPAGLILMAVTGGWVWPPFGPVLWVLAGAVVGVAAYAALTIAMRTGTVAAVTPFRYTRLVFALILGAVVFGERPDVLTLAGAAVVVAAGVFALTWRG